MPCRGQGGAQGGLPVLTYISVTITPAPARSIAGASSSLNFQIGGINTTEVLKIIEAQPGDTFTAKFESLIFRCEQELPGKEQELKYMQMRIDSEHQRLKRIQKSAAELEQSIRNLKYAVDSCSSELDPERRQGKVCYKIT